jgi:hypothetical protein
MVVSLDELKQLARRLDINCVLDVGAHRAGTLGCCARRSGSPVRSSPSSTAYDGMPVLRRGEVPAA